MKPLKFITLLFAQAAMAAAQVIPGSGSLAGGPISTPGSSGNPITAPWYIGTPGYTDTGFFIGQLTVTSAQQGNTYAEFSIQGLNAGNAASTDFVAAADNGTSTTHYVDFGINSSTNSTGTYPTGANFAFVESANDALYVGTVGSNTLTLFTNATPALTFTAATQVGTFSAQPVAPSYALTNGGALTDPGTGAVKLAAAGSNQNAILNASGTGNIFTGTNTNGAQTSAFVMNSAGYSPSGSYPKLRAIILDGDTAFSSSPLAGLGFVGARNAGTYDWPFAAIYGGKENTTAGNQQGFLDFFVTSSSTSGIKAVHINSTGSIDFLNQFTKYNNVSTAGWGVPAIYGSGRSTAQTAAVASISTYTVGAADGSFEVSANMNVTASTALATTLTCTYTDESNTSRTMVFPVVQLTGTFVAAGAITATGAWETPVMHIRCKAATTITIGTTAGTFTGVTYTAEGIIKQMN